MTCRFLVDKDDQLMVPLLQAAAPAAISASLLVILVIALAGTAAWSKHEWRRAAARDVLGILLRR